MAFAIIIGLVLLLAAYVVGVSNLLVLAWNALPLVVAWLVQHVVFGARTQRSKAIIWAAGGFALLTTGVVATALLAWLFDWGGTATGASTAGLMFVVLPVVALLAGGVGWIVGWVLGLKLRL